MSPALKRFRKLFKVDPTTNCWVWTGATNGDGYGIFRLNGKATRAHRASWVLHFSSIGGGLDVCHECDNPPCVNPNHLFLGTHTDNMQDMAAKGRTGHHGLFGEDHQNHKLTSDEVVAIRAEYAAGGVSQRFLAARYGISQKTTWQIIHYELWPHL